MVSKDFNLPESFNSVEVAVFRYVSTCLLLFVQERPWGVQWTLLLYNMSRLLSLFLVLSDQQQFFDSKKQHQTWKISDFCWNRSLIRSKFTLMSSSFAQISIHSRLKCQKQLLNKLGPEAAMLERMPYFFRSFRIQNSSTSPQKFQRHLFRKLESLCDEAKTLESLPHDKW